MDEEEFTYSDDTYYSDDNENNEVSPSVAIENEQTSVVIQKIGPKISKVGSVIRIALKDKLEEANQVEYDENDIVDTGIILESPEKKYYPVTHVIFDLDDTETINNSIISAIAAEYEKEYTPEIQSQVMGRISSEGSIKAVQLMDLPLSPEEFDAKVELENFRLMPEVELLPGVERLVNHLYEHGVPIAVATSSNRTNYEVKSTYHREFFENFNHIVTGGSDPDVINGKPAPDIYLISASRFPDKPKPYECLAFEDSPNGMRAALNAGMQVVMIPDPSVNPELYEDATIVLKSMSDFRPELFGLPAFE
ncbi:pseudouridine-5'-phosphatase-like isoform X2 [Coccinella septempunctata]|uniref:pseudouridine-5'-phosphatase-like isoform X2 n=1 Tax=Coccinella septempunctata TaxID=41139 RepID=UPI001D08115B|nr:pseudouridine-5'-phosphatase-like isoform X2 [Coccinella septempunctata]